MAENEKKKPAEEPVLKAVYQITEGDYVSFVRDLGEAQFGYKRTRTTAVGVIELVLALIILAVVLTGDQKFRQILIVLSVVLIGLGVYSSLFYPVVFPRTLKSSAVKKYQKSSYLQNEITLEFFPNRLVEHGVGNDNEYYWKDVEKVWETDSLYILSVSKVRSILISKAGLGDQRYEVAAFLEAVCKKFGAYLGPLEKCGPEKKKK